MSFMDQMRIEGRKRPPSERLQDWREFDLPLSDGHLKKQASRCMDCGTPYCHTGKIINQAASGCPINNYIPEWNAYVAQGQWRLALERLLATNDFPEFTGRVCPAPCEGSCTLGLIDKPVAIKNIELAIIERGFEQGWIKAQPPSTRSDKKVAIIGSGPAGLACALHLNRSGHNVVVYEKAAYPGGLLMFGIPSMKLEKSVVKRRIDLMAEEGIEFITNTEIGKDVSFEHLRNQFDSIVLCGGAERSRDLNIKGRDAKGIHAAMTYLTDSTQALLENKPASMHAKNLDVVVIGGGDTGTDCIGTALRQNCRSVVQFEIMPAPPEERTDDNPWPEYPKVFKIDYGQEEAKARFGADPRTFNVQVQEFIKDNQGQLQGLVTCEVKRTRQADGRLRLDTVAGSERIWPAQLALLAIGFTGPDSGFLTQANIAQDYLSNVKAENGKFATNLPGVFSAGDMRRGQSLVVWAIAEGRAAAKAVNGYLKTNGA